MSDCVFCDIVNGEAPAEITREWPFALAIVPLNPVVDGHLIVIPKWHLRSAADSDLSTGTIAAYAAQLAAERYFAFNLITSVNAEATQSVYHLHWHIVPRRDGDGLHLPWTGQVTT